MTGVVKTIPRQWKIIERSEMISTRAMILSRKKAITKMTRSYFRTIVLVHLSLVLLVACDRSPESAARAELKELGFSYTMDEFLDRSINGDTSAISLFLTAGMDPDAKNKGGMTALAYAAKNGHIGTARVLLEKNAGVNTENRNGITALINAATAGHADMIQFLAENGAQE